MFRTSELQRKKTVDLEPGELIRISFGGGAGVALFLKHLENRSSLLGVIQAPGFSHAMIWYATRLEEHCLSYGTGWVIDEVHGPESAVGQRYWQENARLFLQEGGLVMSFSPGQGASRFQIISYHLAELVVIDVAPDAAPIGAWRIWESVDHFDRGGEPLFNFPTAE